MTDYLEDFRKLRESIEKQWDIDMKDNSKSSLSYTGFYSDDGNCLCVNSKTHTLEEAIIINNGYQRTPYKNVVKSFARHRCGTTEDGKVCGWWCGDNERGYHSVPVWMFCDDEDYPTIEEALSNEKANI